MSLSFHQLPDEVRTDVLKRCSKRDLVNYAVCSKVCKEEVVPMLWQDMNIDWMYIQHTRVDNVVANLKHTRNLKLSGHKERLRDHTIFNFEFIVRTCDPRTLESLNLSYLIIPNGFKLFTGRIPMLKKLELFCIREKHILDLVPRFKMLESVALESCDEITDDHVKSVCLLKNLRVLKLRNHKTPTGITPKCLDYISTVTGLKELMFSMGKRIPPKYHKEAITKLPNLVRLSLREANIDDQFFNNAVRNFPALEVVDLSKTKVSDNTIISISQMRKVKILELSGCLKISQKGVASLHHLSNLRHLYLNFSDEILRHVAKISSLVILWLSQYEEVSDVGVQFISHLPNLKFLALRGWQYHGARYTDQALLHFRNLKSLQILWISELDITDKSLEVLSEMRVLKELSISRCHKLTDAGLVHLSNLALLECCQNKGLTEDGLRKAGLSCSIFYEGDRIA